MRKGLKVLTLCDLYLSNLPPIKEARIALNTSDTVFSLRPLGIWDFQDDHCKCLEKVKEKKLASKDKGILRGLKGSLGLGWKLWA